MIKIIVSLVLAAGISLNYHIYELSSDAPSWIIIEVQAPIEQKVTQIRLNGKPLKLKESQQYFPTKAVKQGDVYVTITEKKPWEKSESARLPIDKGGLVLEIAIKNKWSALKNIDKINSTGLFRLTVTYDEVRSRWTTLLRAPLYRFSVPFTGGEMMIDLGDDLSFINKIIQTLPVYLPFILLGALVILLYGHRRIVILKALKYQTKYDSVIGLVNFDKPLHRSIRDDWLYEEKTKLAAKSVSWFMGYEFPFLFKRQFKDGLFGDNLLYRAEAYLAIGFFSTLISLPLTVIWLFVELG